MIKKYLPLIIILLIAVPLILFYVFFRDVGSKDQRILSFEAVPENAVILIENQSAADFLQAVNSTRRIKDDLMLVEGLKPVLAEILKFDTLLQKGDAKALRLKNVPFFFSVHQTGDKQYDYFVVLRPGERLGLKDIEEYIRDISGSGGAESARNYSRARISRMSLGDESKQLYLSEIKDYILISPSVTLVEASIRQVRDGISLQEDSDFNKVALSAGQNVHGNIFINLDRFPGLASLAMEGGRKAVSDLRYGTWLELDMTFRPDAILLNGFACAGDTVAWLDIFRRQEPQKIELDQVLPANTLSFFALGFNDPGKYQEDLDAYLTSTGVYSKRQARINDLNKIAGQPVISQFMEIVYREAGLAYLPGPENGLEPVVLIGTQSRSLAYETLSRWMENKAAREGNNLSDYQYSYRIDRESIHTIYSMPFTGIPGLLFGPFFGDVKGNYFGFAGNYLIIADSRQAIQDVIYFKELGKTLSTDLSFKGTVESIVTRSNFYLYSAPFRSSSLYRAKLNKAWDAKISANEEFLQKLGSFSLQIQAQPRSELYFHNLIIKFSDNSPDRPETIWESRLETTLNFKPVLVVNHDSGAREILVQDEAHKLYLVNSSGRILWSLPLEEAINSEIFQVDFFKNRNLQYLFSTGSSLHLLDRNGNYVDKYPVRLRATATNGLALFDYDNNRDYRIFIACSDQHVYLYDKTGSLVKGWDFDKTEGIVSQPVLFQRIANKDYVIFADQMRIYILDRRGVERVRPEKQFAISPNNKLQYEGPRGGLGPRLVVTDVEGSVNFIDFNGKVATKVIKTFSPDHYFTYEDMDKDGAGDFIFLDGDRLEVFGSGGTELFTRKMQSKITHPPAIYRFPGNEKKIGVVTRSREEIFLVNSDGSLYEGFPLRGRTMFTIGYLSSSVREFNLLVGGDNLFLYNYRVK